MASVGTIKYKNGSSWIDILHPVGSVWISHQSDSPATMFGGTWTQLTNAVLRAANEYGYNGSDSMSLTVNQMPAHNHKVNGVYPVTNGSSITYHTTYWGQHTPDASLVDTATTGGGQPFSKLPRYINIYCWVRTA